jgi:hypothetical protein
MRNPLLGVTSAVLGAVLLMFIPDGDDGRPRYMQWHAVVVGIIGSFLLGAGTIVLLRWSRRSSDLDQEPGELLTQETS